jgi:hypothetical protein
VPLLPDLVGRLSSEITPFCSVTGLVFDGADEAGGGWHNYFVGLVGSVSAAEDEILWPNQVGSVEGWSRGAVVHCWCVARQQAVSMERRLQAAGVLYSEPHRAAAAAAALPCLAQRAWG